MPRPQYETAADRTRETAAVKVFTDRYIGVTAKKLDYGFTADFSILSEGKEVALMEVKTRTCTSRTYQTYHVSKNKLAALKRAADKAGVKGLLLVKWTDRTGVISVDKYLDNATFKEGGRKDRGDSFDIELMAEVDIKHFKFI